MVDKVKEHYDKTAETEWNRLNNPYSRIEYNSTLYLIEKYFPKTGQIIDMGSGPGRYSLELLKRGYQVSLLDLSINELEIAKEQARRERRRAIILETQSCNVNAIDFYQHQGFSLIGMDTCCYKNNDLKRKEVRLEFGWLLEENKRLNNEEWD